MTIPCDIMVFGGTGDLALHKLLPALYHLYREGRLHNAVRIIALARRNLPRIDYVKLAERRCRAQIARNDFDEDVWARFSARLDYFSMDASQSADFGRLARFLGEAGGLTRIYYLAT
ncbi:MAG: glucose-6-phosphate dehydrogenase, partial [Pseudomonas sp.]